MVKNFPNAPRKKGLIRQSDKLWFNSKIKHDLRLCELGYGLYCERDNISFKQQMCKVNNMNKYAKEIFMYKIDII